MRSRISRKKCIWISVIFVLLFTTASVYGKTIYVDDDAEELNDGSSWANAYEYLQDALVDANSAEKPVEIRVAQGIYKPDRNSAQPNGTGDRTTSLQLLNGVTLKGGYAGFGASDPNARDIALYKTILSGDLAGNDVDVNDLCDLLNEPKRGENSYHVVTGNYTDETAVLDGFVITAGNANESRSGRRGGGILSRDGKPRVVNCTIHSNSAEWIGGGMAECGSVENCIVEFNWAGDGGGIYSCGPIHNCIIRYNKAENDGGGLNSCSFISGTTISNNSAGRSGGGLELAKSMEDSIISGNFAGAYGGGASNCLAPITNCLVVANRTDRFGGGLYGCAMMGIIGIEKPALTNCTITGNRAKGHGAAIFCPGGTTTVINCILWNNTSTQGDQIALSGECANPTDWGDYQSSCPYGSIELRYSNIPGGPESVYKRFEECELIWLDGNIDVDPCFADMGYWDPNGTPDDPNDDFWVDGDYHLKSQAGRWGPPTANWIKDEVTSPCIDAGDPISPIGEEPFPNGGRINMGAYGGTVEASKSYFGEPTCETIVAGDINGDCKVNFEDFEILALHWLEDEGTQ